MNNEKFTVTEELINKYTAYLKNEERDDNTIEKYARDIRAFAQFLNGEESTKETAIAWKNKLMENFAATSINSMIAAVNGFFSFFEINIKIKPLNIQKQTFMSKEKELTKKDYECLLAAAKSLQNFRLYLVMQTICATGIRVSELQYITVEAVNQGEAVVTNKCKTRKIFIPKELKEPLLKYAKKHDIT
jgi:site-specific recombinase XerD